LKYGSLNLLELSGSIQACTEIALTLHKRWLCDQSTHTYGVVNKPESCADFYYWPTPQVV